MVFKNKQINKTNHHWPGIILHRKFRGRTKQTLKTFQGKFIKVIEEKPKWEMKTTEAGRRPASAVRTKLQLSYWARFLRGWTSSKQDHFLFFLWMFCLHVLFSFFVSIYQLKTSSWESFEVYHLGKVKQDCDTLTNLNQLPTFPSTPYIATSKHTGPCHSSLCFSYSLNTAGPEKTQFYQCWSVKWETIVALGERDENKKYGNEAKLSKM